MVLTTAKNKFKIGKALRLIIYFLVLILFLIGGALSGFNWYLQSNKTKLIEELNVLHGGLVSFSTVKANIWQHFPDFSIIVNDIILCDSLHIEHGTPFMKLSQIRVDLSSYKVLKDSLEIQRIFLQDGQINIFTDANGYSNFNSLFPKSNQKPEKPRETDKEEDFQIVTHKVTLYLSAIDVSFSDDPKYRNIEASINDLVLNIQQFQNQLTADIGIDVQVKELALNTQKGAYLENSRLTGQLNVKIQDSLISIPLSPLRINKQDFTVGADIYSDGQTPTKLYFNNAKTDFSQAAKLLPHSIQKKIEPYHLAEVFETNTIVEGTFQPGVVPKVTIHFKIRDNTAKAKGYSFKHLTTTGRFINRFYDDERSLAEGKKNIRLEFHNITTQHGPFNIQTPKLTLLSRPGSTRVKSNVQITGKAPAISNWLKTQQFLFKKGNFKLDAKINGTLNDISKLINSSHANLAIQNVEVFYKPADVIFPLDRLVLEKRADQAYFEIVSSKLTSINDLNLEGHLKDLPAILITLANQRASSEVTLEAKKISWMQFLNYFVKSPSKEKTDSEKKQSVKKTISGLQYNFQPQFSVAVDTLTYYDQLLLTNFLSGLSFEDEHILKLEETTFYYNEGLIKLSASIDISDPYLTPFELNFSAAHLNLQKLLPSLDYFGIKMLANMDSLPSDLNLSIQHKGIINDSTGLLQRFNEGKITFNDGLSEKVKGVIQYTPGPEGLDTKISIEGNPELLNEFYDAENFFFTNGQLRVDFNYQGDMENIDQLVREAKVNLSISNTEVYYKPVNVFFPIKNLFVNTNEDNAHFNLSLQSDSLKRSFDLKGRFDNLHAFLLDDENRTFHVQAEAYSPKFFWQDFTKLLKPGREETPVARDKHAMRESTKALLHTFDPDLTVKLDTFIYSNQLTVNNVHSRLRLLDSNFLKFEETGFTFHEGAMQLNAQFDLGGTNQAPFEINMQTDNLDIASLMHSLDYMGIKSLQEAHHLAGRLSMQLNLKGIFDGDQQNLVSDATKGTIVFNLYDAELEGFRSIDIFAKKINKERRFADIRFAPLTNILTIDGNHITIPLMEVQSNAIQLFIEGDYHLNDDSNIWISVPLSNIKNPNLDTIPQETGYALAGNMIYLELNIDPQNSNNKIKFRTSKKRFYKKRGLLNEYKIYKKQIRRIRKKAGN